MTIGNVIVRGHTIFVYDEKGKQLTAKIFGSGPDDGLQGYTSTTFSMRQGNTIFTYDEKGRQNFAKPVPAPRKKMISFRSDGTH